MFASGVLGFLVGASAGPGINLVGLGIAVNSLSVFLAGIVAGVYSPKQREVVHGLLAGIAVVVISVPVNLLFGLS